MDTARSRISLRRHARLVDYSIGEGCNARTLVVITTAADSLAIPAGTQFYVRGSRPAADGARPATRWRSSSPRELGLCSPACKSAVLYVDLNTISFYTWGDASCCLPAGATEATLTGNLIQLQPGSLLIFEEVAGPQTGAPEDANPAHRCAVLLTSVTVTDYKDRPLTDPLTGTPITRISWSADDALTFPLCICSTTDAAHGSVFIPAVSVARGNIVPSDHGLLVADEALAPVPASPPAPDPAASCSCGTNARQGPPRYCRATSPVSASRR